MYKLVYRDKMPIEIYFVINKINFTLNKVSPFEKAYQAGKNIKTPHKKKRKQELSEEEKQ
jgi:hypothetical protein